MQELKKIEDMNEAELREELQHQMELVEVLTETNGRLQASWSSANLIAQRKARQLQQAQQDMMQFVEGSAQKEKPKK